MVAGYRKVMGTWKGLGLGTLLREGNSNTNTGIFKPYQTSSMLSAPVLSLENVSIYEHALLVAFSFHSLFFPPFNLKVFKPLIVLRVKGGNT